MIYDLCDRGATKISLEAWNHIFGIGSSIMLLIITCVSHMHTMSLSHFLGTNKEKPKNNYVINRLKNNRVPS
jgi:hypothetical protein